MQAKWEYMHFVFEAKNWKLVHPSNEIVPQALERLGDEGWVLVQEVPYFEEGRRAMHLRRRKEEMKSGAHTSRGDRLIDFDDE
jgi:hypothetical protein